MAEYLRAEHLRAEHLGPEHLGSEHLTAEPLPPVRRQIVVAATPSVAFEAFTTDIGVWWPLASHSVHGAKATVAFIDGDLVEESPEGRAIWGSVLEWAPPQRFHMTWHPGYEIPGADDGRETDILVRFDAIGDGSRTLVTVEHSGWERLATPIETRTGYAEGWAIVIGTYVDHVGASRDSSEMTDESLVWLALSHTPGPDAPADGNVLADARIRQHFGFVSELLAEGVLVGAGPIEGRTGHGMTVIRTTPERVAEYVRRAQEDDMSIVGGLLQVDIAVWSVQLSA